MRRFAEGLFIAYVAGLTAALLVPLPAGSASAAVTFAGLPVPVDRLAHFASYAVAAVLAAAAYRSRQTVWIALAAHGLATELIQGLLPWRSFEWADLAADWGGILVGAVAAAALFSRLLTRSQVGRAETL